MTSRHATGRFSDALTELADLLDEEPGADPAVLGVVEALLAVPGEPADSSESAARTISAHEAAVVCHHFGIPGGYPGSGFTVELVALMGRADWANLGRLAQVFPGYGAAVRLAKGDEFANAVLSAVARSAPEPVGFCCPVCQRVSYHPMDLTQGYCGHCKAWTAPPAAPVPDPPGQGGGVR